ncbi:Arm repeat superfamily protein [Thalictrum thalictroides]|uniref:Arm repeat superfamily protein n=1 Tax=Thalictrum thalictroides TaxID=46969 RepID=A0A7J6W017_THATH|nr:Arm repeat superfamily protein [Thalictrum thalictroides]
MGRNLSPAVRRELANLEKDAESRKMAMKALKSYVKDLDSKAIPQFLAQVSETKAPSSSSVEHTISLYEVLARVHGPNIVPQINNIMSTIIKTLTSSAGSFPLQQACSKVVPAIARYGIDPSTPIEKKRSIIHSLCKPLADCLLGSQESLAFGAALCLKALVDSDNWRFASDEIVNEVCLRVAGALEEKLTQSNSHMALVMALAKHNNFTVEAYARSLIRSGLRILNAGAVEGSSQKRLSAIQMLNFLMKSLDPRSIFSELDIVIEELEKCNSDQMAFVKGAAFEALQTAKVLAADKRQKYEDDTSSVTGSNFGRSTRRRNPCNSLDQSPVSASPESQTVYSFFEDDSMAESTLSMGQCSSNLSYGGRSVNRKLWSNENGGVDVSLKDGLYTGLCLGDNERSFMGHFNDGTISETGDDRWGGFSGFLQTTPKNGIERNTTPSPQRRPSYVNLDNVHIFSTPRKLIRSLQDSDDENSDYSEEQSRRFRSPKTNQFEYSPTSPLDGDHQSHISEGNDIISSSELGEQAEDGSESVSSTGGVDVVTQPEVSHEVSSKDKSEIQNARTQKNVSRKSVLYWVCGLFFILLAIIFSCLWIDTEEVGTNLHPT